MVHVYSLESFVIIPDAAQSVIMVPMVYSAYYFKSAFSYCEEALMSPTGMGRSFPCTLLRHPRPHKHCVIWCRLRYVVHPQLLASVSVLGETPLPVSGSPTYQPNNVIHLYYSRIFYHCSCVFCCFFYQTAFDK